jgi:hypothetical protein
MLEYVGTWHVSTMLHFCSDVRLMFCEDRIGQCVFMFLSVQPRMINLNNLFLGGHYGLHKFDRVPKCWWSGLSGQTHIGSLYTSPITIVKFEVFNPFVTSKSAIPERCLRRCFFTCFPSTFSDILVSSHQGPISVQKVMPCYIIILYQHP